MSEKIKALLERHDWLHAQLDDINTLINIDLSGRVDVHKRNGGYNVVQLTSPIVKDALTRTRGVYQMELDHLTTVMREMEKLV